jgi:hypothetical protein
MVNEALTVRIVRQARQSVAMRDVSLIDGFDSKTS